MMIRNVETFPWGTLTWHHHAEAPFLIGVMDIQAEQVCGTHVHDNANEIIVINKGTVTLEIEGQCVELKTGDSHFIPAGKPHEIQTIGKTLANVTITFDNPNRNYIAVQ